MAIPVVILENWDYLLWGNVHAGEPGGLLLTLMISIVAGISASCLGLVVGISLVLASQRVRKIVMTVVMVLRAIPVLMLIFWVYFLLPIFFGVNLPGVLTVIIALTIISAAYLSQTVLAGIEAIHREQWSAALSLGLTYRQTLREIILPQALRVMLPSFVNQWITLVKDSSLAYIVGVAELTFVATQVNNREQIYPLEIFLCLAFGYFVICSSIAYLGRWGEKHWRLHHHNHHPN